jgi:hypothetical protein
MLSCLSRTRSEALSHLLPFYVPRLHICAGTCLLTAHCLYALHAMTFTFCYIIKFPQRFHTYFIGNHSLLCMHCLLSSEHSDPATPYCRCSNESLLQVRSRSTLWAFRLHGRSIRNGTTTTNRSLRSIHTHTRGRHTCEASPTLTLFRHGASSLDATGAARLTLLLGFTAHCATQLTAPQHYIFLLFDD